MPLLRYAVHYALRDMLLFAVDAAVAICRHNTVETRVSHRAIIFAQMPLRRFEALTRHVAAYAEPADADASLPLR